MIKRKAFIAFFAMALLVSTVSANERRLTKKFLTENAFTFSAVIANCTIKFKSNNRYLINYASEGLYWKNNGHFKIVGQKVYLHPDPKTVTPRSMGKAVCYLKKTPKSIYDRARLIVRSLQHKDVTGMTPGDRIPFSFPSGKIKAGERITFQGMQCISMGQRKGLTTRNVKIRIKPSLQGKALHFYSFLYDPNNSCVPKNTQVKIILRTASKNRIGRWYNYWYLVDVGIMNKVWMYAEFVQVK